MKTVGYAAHSADAHMVPYHFERRPYGLTTWPSKFSTAVSAIPIYIP